jgi:prepilin-type N-terminal cleavage/methylation domain-containing protein
MKNEQGFSLVELLIVVAIIAIIAAIAVPSLLTSRQAANEAGAMQGCRTYGSAEVAFAATNNQQYASIANLVAGNFLDQRFANAAGFNGYTYQEDQAVTGAPAGNGLNTVPTGFGVVNTPIATSARYRYGIGVDQVVRYMGVVNGATPPGNPPLVEGDAIGTVK